MACHIGVDTGLPTIGVAKNLHQIQEFGPQFNRDNVKQRFSALTSPGQYIELTTDEVRGYIFHCLFLKLLLCELLVYFLSDREGS